MIQISVHWDWDATCPNYPWVYQVRMCSEEEKGRCRTMSDCWTAVDSFVAETVAKAIQDSRWSH